MSREMVCGQCQGRMLVEAGGVVVACPTCGAHLQIPPFTDEPAAASLPASLPTSTALAGDPVSAAAETVVPSETPAPEPVAVPAEPLAATAGATNLSAAASPQPTEASPSPVADAPHLALSGVSLPAAVHLQFDLGGDSAAAAPPTSEETAAFGGIGAAPAAEPTPVAEESAELATSEVGPEDVTEPLGATLPRAVAMDESPTEVITAESVAAAEEPSPATESSAAVPPEPSPAAAPVMPAAVVAAPAAAAPVGGMVPVSWLIIVVGYASAVTLALIMFILTSLTRQQHDLESLPDLVPELRNGAVAMRIASPDSDVAPGHVLKLGESQRYGNVRVTPVRITRGMLQFQHAFGQKNQAPDPVGPVLKLWLKFENVSKDQVFPPLDRTLVFKRAFDRRRQPRTNNFLCAEDQRKPDGVRYFLYDMPVHSEFLVVGQDLNQPLQPGATWETFLPSDEQVAEVDGPWVWRVQFRKGCNPKSGRGVTTLIDVQFDGSEVVADEAPAAPQAS